MEQAERLIALLFGGESPEHEVSIDSAVTVACALEELPGTAVEPIYVSKKGYWHWPLPSDGRPAADRVRGAKSVTQFASHFEAHAGRFAEALLRLAKAEYETIFIIIHGPNGEDGRLQGALEMAGLRFVGSGSAASSLAMDKPRCQAYLKSLGIQIPDGLTVHKNDGTAEEAVDRIEDELGYPAVVKPACSGSSCGVTVARTQAILMQGLREAFEFDDTVYAERFVEGRELTCTVIDRAIPVALPLTEIIPPEGRVFDYEAKYKAGVSIEITPAEIDDGLGREIQRLAVRVHKAVGCRGFSRTDFIYGPEGPIVLEINTLPGMTHTSLVPQAARAAGMKLSELVALLVEDSLRPRR